MATIMIDSVDQTPAPKRIALGNDSYTAIHKTLTERLAALARRRLCGSGTSERKPQGRTNLLHPLGAQVADAAPQSRLGHGNGVVQVYCATTLHSVIDIQYHFGRHAANGRRDRSDGYSH
jgi:hypothetical protein